MALTVEDLNHSFAKVIDHLRATSTPNDGGVTESVAKAVRDAFVNDPNLQKHLLETVNNKPKPAPAPNPAPAPTPLKVGEAE